MRTEHSERASWSEVPARKLPAEWLATFTIVFMAVSLCERTRGAEQPSRLSLEVERGGSESRVVVVGGSAALRAEAAAWSDDEWQRNFRVQVLIDQRPVETQLLGDYSVAGDKLVFSPRYPLRAGVSYRLTFRASRAGTGLVTRDVSLPASAAPPTNLTQVFPTRAELPENLLKFYLHFSAPMSRGEVYRRVRLVDGTGKQVEFPFLELSEELWSPDGTRLTLYFDPGRIKRGLKPRELFGPALLEGGSYTLEVDRAWLDADGRPLTAGFKKSFRVLAPDDIQPDIQQWKVVPPTAGTRDRLRVQFEEPLDAAMLVRVLTVATAEGAVVRGVASIARQETEWSFQPGAPWTAGRYKLIVASTLEDLAGNSLGRPFEVDVFRPARELTDDPVLELSFEIR